MTPLKSCAFVRRRGSDMDYKYHETEICHNWRLGCWLPVEGQGAVAARWVRRVVEGLAFAVLVVVLYAFCALCAVA